MPIVTKSSPENRIADALEKQNELLEKLIQSISDKK